MGANIKCCVGTREKKEFQEIYNYDDSKSCIFLYNYKGVLRTHQNIIQKILNIFVKMPNNNIKLNHIIKLSF